MSRIFDRERGYVVLAQNGRHDYLRMAYGLALSLKVTQSTVNHLSVLVTPNTFVPDRYKEVFDDIIDIPWRDEAADAEWKLQNEWKTYHVTPYRHTVKLDADMLFTQDVSHWWSALERQDVMACSEVSTYRGDAVTSDACRKIFTANNLPNIYTALMSFQYSSAAEDLFSLAELIFHNWEKFSEEFLNANFRPQEATTDVVFALAMKLLQGGRHYTQLAGEPGPSFVHMKPQLQGWEEGSYSSDWTQHLPVSLSSDMELRIGRYTQTLPFHYHEKNFLNDRLIRQYETRLGI